MSKALVRWWPELRDDGVWEPAAARLLATATKVAIVVSAYVMTDSAVVGALGLLYLAVFIWRTGYPRWGFGDRMLFGLDERNQTDGPKLVAQGRNIPVDTLDRLTVCGPLQRREFMIYPKTGMPFAVMTTAPPKLIQLAEQYLRTSQGSLPFEIEIRAPESPFLHPHTVL